MPKLLTLVFKVLKRILFNLHVFFIGFRFYKTNLIGNEKMYDQVVLNFNYGQPWVFTFYRTPIEYHEYRFGRFGVFKRTRFSIGVHFTEDHPDLVRRYNDKLMSFYVPYSDLLTEASVSKYLLDNYVEHIIHEIRMSKEQEQFFEE